MRLLPKQLLKPAVVVAFLLFAFIMLTMQMSCKKTDSILPETEEQIGVNGQPVNLTEHFFALPANAGSAVQRVAAQMRKQNSNIEFITSFVKNNGFAIWDKAIISVGKPKITNSHLGETNVENNGDTTVIVPLVQTDSAFVGGFLKAVIADTISIELYKNRDYQALPYAGAASVTQSNVTTAENYALRMMLMDNLVFGYTKFTLKDKRLFAGNSTADTSKLERVVDFGSGNNNFAGGGTSTSNYIYSLCVTVTTTTYVTTRHCGTPEYCTAHVGLGLCDNCGTYCYLISTPQTTSTTECQYWDDGQGGGSTGWPEFPPTGGGGGTGGGGTSPCGAVEAITESVVPLNCPLIPNPWPPIIITTTPGPTNDSIVKAILKKDNIDLKNHRDSIFNKAYTNDEEWHFYIKNVNGIIKNLGDTTDHDPDAVTPDPFTRANGNPDGDYHTHQDHPSPDYRHPHDPQDVSESNGWFKKLYYRSYVDCGDTLYAVVTENVSLVKHLFQTQRIRSLMDLPPWDSLGSKGNERRAFGLQLLKNLLGNSAVTGLGLYKSVDANKTEFVKLN